MIQRNRSRAASLAILAVGLAAGCLDAQTLVGGVTGKLITESGQPLPGVTAVYRRAQLLVATPGFHSRPAPGEVAVSGTVTTRADGTFTIAGIPAGNYSLCIDNPPALYVDHCAWNLSGTDFTVVAGGTTALKPVTIISGVRIHFLITDPHGLLPATAELEPVAHIGVMTPNGIYRSAAVISRSGALTELVVTVPHNQPISASVFSRTLKFADADGSLAKPSPITPTLGAIDHNVALTVSK